MFLIAGLLGMVVSGVMMIAPLGLQDDAGDTEDTPTGPDLLSEERASAVGDPGDETAPPDPQTGQDGPAGPVMDLLSGAYASDAIGGSDMPVIAYESDAVFGSISDETITGGDGDELILGNDGSDILSGEGGRDELIGGTGDDDLFGGDSGDILWGGDGADNLDGGDGDDLLAGGDGDDALTGGNGDDRLFGQAGSDLLDGGAGNDILDGSEVEPGPGAHHDILRGGDGDDTLAGGTGDSLTGGSGADTYLFSAPSAGALVADPANAPLITDFDLDEDQIEVAFEGTPPAIAFATDGEGTSVMADGVVVARIDNVVGLTPDHVGLIQLS